MGASPDANIVFFVIADRQAGFFSLAQAQDAGYSDASQSYHRKQGHWLDEGWSIYRLRNYPATSDEELVRLMLRS